MPAAPCFIHDPTVLSRHKQIRGDFRLSSTCTDEYRTESVGESQRDIFLCQPPGTLTIMPRTSRTEGGSDVHMSPIVSATLITNDKLKLRADVG